MPAILENQPPIVKFLVALVIAIGAALLFNYILFTILRRISKRNSLIPDGSVNKHCRGVARVILLLIACRFVLPFLETIDVDKKYVDTLLHIIGLLLIVSVSCFVIKLTKVLEDVIVSRFEVDVEDNLRARKVHTQLRVLRRIVIVVVGILALGTMLMTFEKIRQLGTTILASAGIIGIVVGMAAQRTIGTFIAGLQIAFTQPIRVDDVVIVENEWGRIEEITLTYVVVRIWDLRRLIVPITYFIEKPFQNWTRTTADILGSVFLYVDYTVPVEAIREELQRILGKSQHWDRKVCVLQVTNTSERTIELRALMSSSDASTAWTLRCEVREKLVSFIRKNYPEALPRVRAELEKLQD
ncbi:MAG: mechanosensitive ion channel family protein [Planctomycetota bacterium]|jgi:small-conductance mechanosensitive channel